jgi:hypothetical protein
LFDLDVAVYFHVVGVDVVGDAKVAVATAGEHIAGFGVDDEVEVGIGGNVEHEVEHDVGFGDFFGFGVSFGFGEGV